MNSGTLNGHFTNELNQNENKTVENVQRKLYMIKSNQQESQVET